MRLLDVKQNSDSWLEARKQFRQLPSVEYLRECFTYDARTGKLFWKFRPLEHFKKLGGMKIQHTRFAGKEVKTLTFDGRGRAYVTCYLDNKRTKAHRIIYKLCTGKDPEQIDHKNGDTLDNRISNLRSVDNKTNAKNRVKPINNVSGISGVHWDTRKSRWMVQGSDKTKRIHLMTTQDFFEACCARKSYLIKTGYTARHGA